MKKTLTSDVKRIIASLLLIMVVFSSVDIVTLYSFASNLTDKTTICGLEEHSHSTNISECYQDNLICTQNTTKPHEHIDTCYDNQFVQILKKVIYMKQNVMKTK